MSNFIDKKIYLKIRHKMANVHVKLGGNLSDILYQTSAAFIVSTYTQKPLTIDIKDIDVSNISIVKDLSQGTNVYKANVLHDINITDNDIISKIPKCRKSIELFGKFRNKNFYTNYRKDLIALYNLEKQDNLENSIFLYLENDNKRWYNEKIYELFFNTNYDIIVITKDNSIELDTNYNNNRIKTIKNEDDYRKLCIMANCKKGGYYTGNDLGWWGSFLNDSIENIESNEKIYEKNNPSVFITMPTYNNGEKCVNVIDQIVNQSYKKWKLCIIDNGSSEEDDEMIKKKLNELNDFRIFYLKLDMPLIKILNKGIDLFLENGFDRFTYISDDNDYYPDFIKNLVIMDKDFVYSGHIIKQGKYKLEVNKEYKKVEEILESFLGVYSCMWSRNAIKWIGYYNDSLTLSEDYDYIIRTFLQLKPEQIEYLDILNMEYTIYEDIDFVNEKKLEVVEFYKRIDITKPLFMYYMNDSGIINTKICSSYMNNNYNVVFLRDNSHIEYDSEKEIIYTNKNDLNLLLNLFNLINDKVIVYNDIDIFSKIKDHTNVTFISEFINISIVMAYYDNRKKQILNTLENFEKNYLGKYNFEVIIVDDNSLEENRLDEEIKRFSYPINYRYITKEEKGDRINPCIAYNIGFTMIKGEIVVIQNPECYHVGDILGNILKNINNNTYLTYSCFSGNTRELTMELISDTTKINNIEYLNRNQMNCNDINWYNHPVYNKTNYHFCSAITKSNLELLGGFDEGYADGYCFDDDDFLLTIEEILKINVMCMNVENGFVIHQYHTRNIKEEDTNINKKWLKNRNRFNDKKKYLETSKFNYPRLLHLYWDGSPLSLLNFCTILSFNEYHKYWRIILYMPTKKTDRISWVSQEQKYKYTEKCYQSELKKISNLTVKYVDFDSIGFDNDASEVIKSDYFRYYILQKYGGVWSDMDIIYTSNIENKIKCTEDVVLFRCTTYEDPKNKENSSKYDYYPIGWFIAKRGNDFFNYILEECRQRYDPSNYQTLGAVLFNTLFYDISKLYKNVNYKSNIVVLNEDYYLPWAWNELDEFLVKIDNKLPENNFGIHWFNGADKSKRYANELTNRIINKQFSVKCYLDKFIYKYVSFFDRSISIIMAYHNKKDQLLMTLDTINKTKYDRDLIELIIVDDHSKEGERLTDFLEKEKYNFEIKTLWIEKKEFYNPCYAYNLGIKESTGNIIILQNPEVMLLGDCIQYVADNLKPNDWLTLNTYGLGSFEENELIKHMSKIEIYNLLETYTKIYQNKQNENIKNTVEQINIEKENLNKKLLEEKNLINRLNKVRITILDYEIDILNEVKLTEIRMQIFRDLNQEKLDIEADIEILEKKKKEIITSINNLKEVHLNILREKVQTGGNTYLSDKNIGGWLNYYDGYFLGYHYFAAINRNDLMEKMQGGFYEEYKNGICFDDNDFVMYLHYHNFNFKINRFERDNCFVVHLFHEKSCILENEMINKLWLVNKEVYDKRCEEINYPKEVDIALKDSKYVPKAIII